MNGVDSMKSLWMDIYRYIFIIVGEEKTNTPGIKAAIKTNTVQNNKFEKCQLFKFLGVRMASKSAQETST